MKKTILITIFPLLSLWVQAQTSDTTRSLKNDSVKVIDSDTTIYNYDDIKSQLPDNISSHSGIIAIPVKYPKSAMENGIQGTVIATFIVEKDGSVSNIKIIKKIDRDLDNEVIRVLKLSPKWKPFILNGHLIRVRYKLPVPFKIND